MTKTEIRLASQRGKSYPIAKDSREKSKSINCIPNPSGVSAWHILECGVRVCVMYKDNKAFHWRPSQVKGEIK